MAKKKQKNTFSAKELEHYRQLLIEKMMEILGDVTSMEEAVFQNGGELSSMPVHLADIGTDSYEQEFNLDLMAEERKTLVQIQNALKRIEDGSFGICEGLDIPIEPKRLEAIPWTCYSLEYARLLESGKSFDIRNIKLRPNDIQREEDFDEDEDIDNEEEVSEEDTELDNQMISLDDLEDEEDGEDEDDDLNRRRNSA